MDFRARPRGVASGVLWVLGLLLLVALLGVISYLFPQLGLWLRPPRAWLAPFWLPTVGFLVYIILWLGWRLWKLRGPEAVASHFPDIDESWDEAVRALHHAEIDVGGPPLFLVLGQPQGTEAALFEGAQLQLTVTNAPSRETAPLHVYANRDGIYVTCAGASLLGRQAAILAGEVAGHLNGAGEDGAIASAPFDPRKTIRPEELGGTIQDIKAIMAEAERQRRELTEEERANIRRMEAEDRAKHEQLMAKQRPLLLRDPEEVKLLTARLKHLCRLLVRDRNPYCPINGILLLISIAATDRKVDADQTGAICQQDLAAVRQALQVYCPLIALVCDMETVPGFREFVGRCSAELRQRRLGQRFPLAPDLAEGESHLELVDRVVQWICGTLFPTWIYKLFRVETAGREDMAAAVRANGRLFQLLTQVRDRRQLLSSIFVRGLATEKEQPWLLGGCYLASTSRDVLLEQAFVPGVFRRLTDNQDYVSWTADALKEEEDYHSWTTYGYAGVGAVAVLLAFCAFFLWK